MIILINYMMAFVGFFHVCLSGHKWLFRPQLIARVSQQFRNTKEKREHRERETVNMADKNKEVRVRCPHPVARVASPRN